MTVKKITDILEIDNRKISKYSNSRILLVLIKNAFAKLNGLDGLIYEDRLNYKRASFKISPSPPLGRQKSQNIVVESEENNIIKSDNNTIVIVNRPSI